MEVDVGSWSGLTRSEVEARFPGRLRALARVRPRLGRRRDATTSSVDASSPALSNIGARHPDEHVLAVTHGGPIRSALAAAEGVPFEEARRSIHVLGNCAVVRIAVRDGKLERVD